MIMKKIKFKIDNRMKAYGTEQGGLITINKKKHKGDKAELANTILHEKLHVKHPQAKEKTIQKKAKVATENMSYAEKAKLIAKIRMKNIHRKEGVLKKKFKMAPGQVEPGAYISKVNEANSKKEVAIRGLV